MVRFGITGILSAVQLVSTAVALPLEANAGISSSGLSVSKILARQSGPGLGAATPYAIESGGTGSVATGSAVTGPSITADKWTWGTATANATTDGNSRSFYQKLSDDIVQRQQKAIGAGADDKIHMSTYAASNGWLTFTLSCGNDGATTTWNQLTMASLILFQKVTDQSQEDQSARPGDADFQFKYKPAAFWLRSGSDLVGRVWLTSPEDLGPVGEADRPIVDPILL